MQTKIYRSDICKAEYEKILHPSGLVVYFMKMQEKSKKAAMISAKFGSINYIFKTPEGRSVTVPNGTAHFLEHKLFEGKNGGAFEYYAKTGAKANAYTSNDKTAYYFICSQQFEENLEVLLSFVSNPYLTEENVEKEKGIIAQEIKMYDDEPGWQGYFMMVQGLYQNHPIRRDIAGTVEDIYSLTPEILMDCYRTFYHPSNMVLAVAGDVDRKTVMDAVDRYFKGEGCKMDLHQSISEPRESLCLYTEKEMLVSKPIFHLGFKDSETEIEGSELSKKEMEVEILLEYLFGHSSPFYTELYEKGLINNNCDCWYDLSEYFSFCAISGESDDPKAVEACALKHLNSLFAGDLDEERFKEIRNGLYGSIIIETDQAYPMVNRIVGNYMNRQETFDALEALLQIKPEDLVSRAKKMFCDDARCLSVINPVKEEV